MVLDVSTQSGFSAAKLANLVSLPYVAVRDSRKPTNIAMLAGAESYDALDTVGKIKELASKIISVGGHKDVNTIATLRGVKPEGLEDRNGATTSTSTNAVGSG